MSELEPTRTHSNQRNGGSEKTARKRLRELLDDDPRVQWFKELPGVTYWTEGTHPFIAEEYGDGKLELKTLVTPEQAIAATLGNDGVGRTKNGVGERGTCHITKRKGSWYCDGCGNEVGDDDPTSELFIDGNAIELWEFCPCCGRKVVDE